MSIGSIIKGGLRLIHDRPRLIATWAVVYFAVSAAMMAAMQPLTVKMVAAELQVAAAAGANTPPDLKLGEWAWQLFLLELAMLFLLLVAFAAVVRAITRPEEDRFAYLRLGMDELRLFGLGVIFTVAVFLAEIGAILILAIIGIAVAAVAGKGAAILVFAVLAVALLCGLLYAEVRLSLAGALTVMRGRIVITEAWRVTRGRFWQLSAVYLLLTLVVFVVWLVATILLVNPDMLSAYAASIGHPEMSSALLAQIAAQNAGMMSVGGVARMVFGAVLGTLIGVALCGAVATAALELAGEG